MFTMVRNTQYAVINPFASGGRSWALPLALLAILMLKPPPGAAEFFMQEIEKGNCFVAPSAEYSDWTPIASCPGPPAPVEFSIQVMKKDCKNEYGVRLKVESLDQTQRLAVRFSLTIVADPNDPEYPGAVTHFGPYLVGEGTWDLPKPESGATLQSEPFGSKEFFLSQVCPPTPAVPTTHGTTEKVPLLVGPVPTKPAFGFIDATMINYQKRITPDPSTYGAYRLGARIPAAPVRSGLGDRDLIRNRLVDAAWEGGTGEMIGPLVYDHHVPELGER